MTRGRLSLPAVGAIVAICVAAAAIIVGLTAGGHSSPAPSGSRPSHTSRPGRTAAPGARVRHIAWPAPALTDPVTIHLTSANAGKLRLAGNRDYRLVLPAGRPLQAPDGLRIAGGHNVVLIGGTVNVPDRAGAGELEDQSGTIHLEGVRFTGPQLMEGLDLQDPRATVELENVYFGTVHGSHSTNHADLIQSWAGPRRLLIDGLTGSTQYQGFFLLPNQHNPGPPPQLFDFRHVYINDMGGAYALWLQTSPRVPLHLQDVNVTPNRTRPWPGWWLMPKPAGNTPWPGVRAVGQIPPTLERQIAPAGLFYAHP